MGRSTEPMLSCSFCGKSQKEVEKLIAGPSVYICNECVDLCNDILAHVKAQSTGETFLARVELEERIQELEQLRLIRNPEQHEAGLQEIRRLISLRPAAGSEESERLQVLALLVETYERKTFPIDPPTPQEAAEFRAEQEPGDGGET